MGNQSSAPVRDPCANALDAYLTSVSTRKQKKVVDCEMVMSVKKRSKRTKIVDKLTRRKSSKKRNRKLRNHRASELLVFCNVHRQECQSIASSQHSGGHG
ncbi:hypothetical protein THRCLA_21808 [Thraustotheca clavata]|uniref:Uncharacterized protein n=1 Tax=Thraustotheca clavata TaxID=74557 RepID=A0A1V9ZNU4_9STRA|nr:hypothetical protein THRCLA_21808 [Thraustotheca clavata]